MAASGETLWLYATDRYDGTARLGTDVAVMLTPHAAAVAIGFDVPG